ncbi:tetratricopeptide repeat protein [Lentiprolixibacter aurantiacus]|uniref:Tetratricopeptide repeat protein n=1 Tax=Lentiprolixibacter aurantiacus TaxID=2993939 RepID=A0AAE3MJC5_9FLAO|nr:tetratricopeptide repeat protein [Lentiprolixibacter aurantiacus]MCX2718371.1 tetratricopeptide repeat protein [Lentiprolixibacter aurantiacus]
MNKTYYILSLALIFLSTLSVQAQETEADPEHEKALRRSTNLTWEANKELSENDFVGAEADYRRAISKSTENIAAPYNLGNAYYNRESFSEAFGRFKQAGELAIEKADKHRAFHNLGNVFMKNKEYQKAVEAYKEALRNNPKDEETRYNLALAKEMLKKDQENQQNQDNQDNQEDQDEKDEKEQNQDNQGQQEQDQNQEQQDQQQGEQEKEENKEGEGEEKQEQEKQPQENDGEQKKQPKPNQLSPQQIKNLLEAMQNEEKKVQEKMDAKKVKGAKIKNVKDW